MADLIAFDIETTGLSPYENALLEIAGVKFRVDGAIFETFQELANPGSAIPEAVRAITGLTDEMVAARRPPIEVLRAFLVWAGPDPYFLAHNASFDIRFINAAFLNSAEPAPNLRLVDTLAWARERFPERKGYALGELLEAIGAAREGLHRALGDAMGVRALVMHLLAGEPEPLAAVAKRVNLPLLPRRQSLLPDSMLD
ncbi:MAG TPA: 3'-5' exonuclease [Candidatus Hydrogenedentes bacterium]|nr:3'-5' exonuclease [Candidatus Hydrogenedentota bacterium]HQM51330.1 3'-5' exonuclease [Candidatus Hydrogenedentota bacterium]